MAATTGLGASLWEPLLQKALAVRAHNATRSIQDVEHIVILMQENRSFDHYFGAMRGVRGFGDRFAIPLESGKPAFHQSDGERIVPPYRADKKSSDEAFIAGTPHNFPDMQAAWNQGKYGYWPLFKTPYSMAYYTREEIPSVRDGRVFYAFRCLPLLGGYRHRSQSHRILVGCGVRPQETGSRDQLHRSGGRTR
jgi:phospholipase C